MDFEQRLSKAIQRGHRTSEEKALVKDKKQLTEDELRSLHSQFRLPLTEQIESCLRRLPDHFPGFQYSTVMDEKGWGAEVRRDDVGAGSDGKRANFFSRLEMVIRPFSKSHVVDLAAKGAIRNKEIFNRSHYQRLTEADLETFAEMIDLWVLEYVELYAAKS